MRRVAIGLSLLFALLCAAGAAAALDWWHEAQAPMTAEKYAALCGGPNTPECYPEIGYMFGALMIGTMVSGAGVLTVIVAGISSLPGRFLARLQRKRPIV